MPTDVSVSLSPAAQTIPKGQKATVSILLTNTSSPGRSINLYSSEVYLTFDAAFFSVSNLGCNGTFLSSPAVANVSGNTISLACFAPGGSGTRTIAGGGQATLGSFDITALDKEGASPITFSRVNVPDATAFTDLSGGTGTGGTYTVAAVGGLPAETPTPTPAPGQPNSCGGTCGSDANCQSGLFCYLGLCRSPSCPSSINCSCATVTPTAKPKPKGTAGPTPTASPTLLPSPIAYVTFTPSPTETETPTPQPQPAKGPNPIFLAGIGAGILFLLIALLAVFRGRGGNPPKITPPTPLPPQPPPAPPAAPPAPPSPV